MTLYGYISNTEDEEPKLVENWDSKGRVYYTDNNGNKVKPQSDISLFQRLKNKAQATADNVSQWINETNPESEAYKQKANIALAAITAPMGLGATATKALGTKLIPVFGNKIGQGIAQIGGSGLVSGAAEGYGRGLIEGENPLKAAAIDGTIGMLGGSTLGLGFGKLGQNLAFKNLYKNKGNNEVFDSYFNDYIDGLNNYSKQMADFRAAKQGIRPQNTKAEKKYLFIGENAFNAPRGKLMEAKQMDMYGDSNADIRNATGWFKGVDGKWRYEIQDGKMINEPHLVKEFDDDIGTYYTGKLSDIYDSPELYQAYPRLKDTSVVIQDMPNGTMGSSLGGKNGGSISINRDLYKTLSPEYLEKINKIENSPEYINFKKYENDMFNKMDSSMNNAETMNQLMNEYDNAAKEFYNNNPIGKEYSDLVWHTPKFKKEVTGWNDESLKTLVHEIEHQVQDIEDFARGGNLLKNPNDYNKLAGEVEARLAGARANLTPEQRQIYNPANESTYLSNYGYDVIPEKQIVEFRDNGSNLYNKIVGDDEFDYNKVMEEVKKRKNGDYNPLKYRGKSVKMDNITNREQEFVFHEIDTHISEAEKLKGKAIRRLPNPENEKDYIYHVKYDKTGNGKHKITKKYEVTDEKYD